MYSKILCFIIDITYLYGMILLAKGMIPCITKEDEMRLDHTWIQLEPEAHKKEKRGEMINVLSGSMYIDNFGKYHTFTKIFDQFSLIKQVWENKDKLEQQARNCLEHPFDGWKL